MMINLCVAFLYCEVRHKVSNIYRSKCQSPTIDRIVTGRSCCCFVYHLSLCLYLPNTTKNLLDCQDRIQGFLWNSKKTVTFKAFDGASGGKWKNFVIFVTNAQFKILLMYACFILLNINFWVVYRLSPFPNPVCRNPCGFRITIFIINRACSFVCSCFRV